MLCNNNDDDVNNYDDNDVNNDDNCDVSDGDKMLIIRMMTKLLTSFLF